MSAAQLTIGDLVRVTNPDSYYVGMTGRVVSLEYSAPFVHLTTRDERHLIPLSDLTVVRQPASARRADERAA